MHNSEDRPFYALKNSNLPYSLWRCNYNMHFLPVKGSLIASVLDFNYKTGWFEAIVLCRIVQSVSEISAFFQMGYTEHEKKQLFERNIFKPDLCKAHVL